MKKRNKVILSSLVGLLCLLYIVFFTQQLSRKTSGISTKSSESVRIETKAETLSTETFTESAEYIRNGVSYKILDQLTADVNHDGEPETVLLCDKGTETPDAIDVPRVNIILDLTNGPSYTIGVAARLENVRYSTEKGFTYHPENNSFYIGMENPVSNKLGYIILEVTPNEEEEGVKGHCFTVKEENID